MARYLVVAHQTATSPELLARVDELRAQDPQAEFVLLVPATPVRHLLRRRSDEHDADTAAHRLVERARARFARRGTPLADARVGASSPVDAVDEEIRGHPGYAGVVVSTLPKEKSRWLRLDLPRVIAAQHGLPVHHVVAEREWSLADLP
jgi:hypothetical protein